MVKTSLSNDVLRQHHLLGELNDEQLDKIKKTLRFINLSDGEHLFEQGQNADRFYQVLSGQIKLYLISMEGSERVIEVMQEGQTFAEAVIFMEERCYPVNSESIGKTELLAFDSDTFLNILAESKDACFRLLSDMSKRLHHRLNEIDYLTLQNATFRLIHYLLKQIPADHEDDDTVEIKLTTSKSIVASRLSIQPETFSRILKKLGKQELISVKGKVITLLDVEALRNFDS
ncbi:MAG: Crp/Fnr family transcriptional regulator [Gammaproteobacteria bacterium]|nr:Crp/Fnr family transcriptional regulator [Gammaproteobacteria bacterium]MCW8909949.1 Crp/Fnr family transcriptional regulator [Gammaproteobacteria bacterium]MCW9005417.1 Crp/Fnr family transcriptional regulator [Gammaproteobacteria bacterium]MCW9055119.1 Crp/Fnr family transcriptional regulator [Gammaproteobacteria bacterium]